MALPSGHIETFTLTGPPNAGDQPAVGSKGTILPGGTITVVTPVSGKIVPPLSAGNGSNTQYVISFSADNVPSCGMQVPHPVAPSLTEARTTSR